MTHPSTPPPPPTSSPPPPATTTTTTISLILYFDPSLENQVLKSWNSLARRHISSHLISTSSRPHLPLLSFPSPSPSPSLDRLLPSLRSIASRLDPLPLTLSSVSALPSPHDDLLFLSPTPTLPLLNLHHQLADLVRKEGADLPDEWRPDSWLPRCDAAREVARGRLAEGFAVLREMRLPVSGYAVEIGVVEGGEGGREIGVVPLGTAGEQ